MHFLQRLTASRTMTVLAMVWLALCILILLITLTPTPVDKPYGVFINHLIQQIARVPGLRWFTYDWLERLSNLIMFVPFSAVLTYLVGRRWWWAVVLASASMSCAVELFQLLLLPERTASVIDVLTNTSGAVVGAGVVALALKLREKRRGKSSFAA